MDYKKILEKKKKWWTKIKSLEQQYKRNLDDIDVLEEHNSDISFKIQQLIDKIDGIGEEYDNYCYQNSVGEFSDENKLLDADFMDALEDLADSKINNKPTKERWKE